jgi:hypothetical protein
MRAFVFACIGAIAIAIIGAVALGSIRESADQAFFDFGCAPWSVKPNVRLWPIADIPIVTSDVRFRGKADMARCDANVCF